MGGATFPTHVKLSPPPDKTIDTVIINGAECEPFLTADHRLMLERPEDVVFGLKVIMKVLGVDKGYIGVEDNKPDCVEALQKAAAGEPIEVKALHTKYPQGAEKQLIYAFTGREVPPGGLPMDVGSVVQNAGTAAAIADAVLRGMPTVERIVTVTGPGVAEPANLLVKVGTMVSEVISQCGGLKENARKVILGGPMMGLAQTTMEMPVIKGTSGILVLTDEEVKIQEINPASGAAGVWKYAPSAFYPLPSVRQRKRGSWIKRKPIMLLIVLSAVVVPISARQNDLLPSGSGCPRAKYWPSGKNSWDWREKPGYETCCVIISAFADPGNCPEHHV
jgi:Na+-translocating ferredoxin:NAD+ oxidoreductase subunit C